MNVPPEKFQEAQQLVARLTQALHRAVIGQDQAVVEIVLALLAGGHVLIEGVPGLGKTLLVKGMARALQCQFARIQFTPDLMPADVTGHTLFDAASGRFVARQGPVFTHLLLADEINRAPAKTQAALLEAMQEGQVTLDGKTQNLPAPFMVLATQNPIEQEGTYPLPEAQLDRFLLKILIGYPSAEEERALTRHVTGGQTAQWLNVEHVTPLAAPDVILTLQRLVAQVEIDDRVLEYMVALVRATRGRTGFQVGAGPRGSIALVRAARARAVIAGRGFVTPDDVRAVALPALRHRVVLSAESEIEGIGVDTLLGEVMAQVPAPRE